MKALCPLSISLAFISLVACQSDPIEIRQTQDEQKQSDQTSSDSQKANTILHNSFTKKSNRIKPKQSYRDTISLPDMSLKNYRIHNLAWHRQVELSANRNHLRESFERRDYEPPEKALLVAARIHNKAPFKHLDYFSLDDTGFYNSADHRFFVASAIKLPTTVAVLSTLKRKWGLSSAANIRIEEEIDGPFEGSLSYIIHEVLLHSSNLGYNRLMGMAGFDYVNRDFFTTERGLPRLRIKARYAGKRPGYSFRNSPAFSFEEDTIKGFIPERKGRFKTENCRIPQNCVSLYGLQEVMRRVMLNDDLPLKERFNLFPDDIVMIQALLLKARNRLQPGVKKVMGEDTKIYNSVGRQPGQALVENAYLSNDKTNEHLLIAALVPFDIRPDPTNEIKRRLVELVKEALTTLKANQRQHPLYLHQKGGFHFGVSFKAEHKIIKMTVKTQAPALDAQAWRNGAPLKCKKLSFRIFRCDFSQKDLERENLFTIELYGKNQTILAYRHLGLVKKNKKKPANTPIGENL